MDTTDYTNKAPYLNDEENELEQTTVDSCYFDELVKIKKLTKRYFEVFDFPMDKTNDELMEMFEIKKKLKRLL